jgi:hypothetical protein
VRPPRLDSGRLAKCNTDPDSIEEGNAILDAFEQQDREDWEAEQKEKKDAKK